MGEMDGHIAMEPGDRGDKKARRSIRTSARTVPVCEAKLKCKMRKRCGKIGRGWWVQP